MFCFEVRERKCHEVHAPCVTVREEVSQLKLGSITSRSHPQGQWLVTCPSDTNTKACRVT